MKRNKIRIFLGTVLTLAALLGGCTCRASVKPMATAMPTGTATVAPTAAATTIVTVVPAASQTPMASDAVSPSMSPMASEGTGSGTP